MEVFYRDNDGYNNYVKVDKPNGKIATLDTYSFTTAANIIFKSKRVSINGESISQVGFTGEWSLNTTAPTVWNCIYITKVVAYR